MSSTITFKANFQNQQTALTYDFQSLNITVQAVEKTAQFALQHTWWNGVPAQHDSSFISAVSTKEDLKMEIKGEELHLNHPTFRLLNVQIKQGSGSYSLQTSPSLTIEGLKIQIEKSLRFPVQELCLKTYSLNDSLTIQDCGIEENSLLTVALRPEPSKTNSSFDQPGNSLETGFTLLDFNSLDGERALLPNPRAPKWQTIRPGLTFAGTCSFEKCLAKDQTVCVPQGFNTFKLADDPPKTNCPECKNALTRVDDCLFWDCVYSIEGKRRGEYTLKKEENREAPTESVLGFAYQPSQWEFLNITVEEKKNREVRVSLSPKPTLSKASPFFTWKGVAGAFGAITLCVVVFELVRRKDG